MGVEMTVWKLGTIRLSVLLTAEELAAWHGLGYLVTVLSFPSTVLFGW
jgi:hypothetical protein